MARASKAAPVIRVIRLRRPAERASGPVDSPLQSCRKRSSRSPCWDSERPKRLFLLKLRAMGRKTSECTQATATPNAPAMPIWATASTLAKLKESRPIMVVRAVKTTGLPVMPTAAMTAS